VSHPIKAKVRKNGVEKTYLLERGAEEGVGSSALTLLERFEKVNARMPFGCRSGACGAGLVLVNNGAELLVPADAVEGDTLVRCGRGPTARLACRARLVPGADAGELSLEVPEQEETIY
jgi:ferredoxin